MYIWKIHLNTKYKDYLEHKSWDCRKLEFEHCCKQGLDNGLLRHNSRVYRKASKLVSVNINNDDTHTLVDRNILNKKDVLWHPKKYALIENKRVYLIWYIFY